MKVASGSDLIVTPAELQAVEVHKYFLSLSQHREVPIDDAIRDFRLVHSTDWLVSKMRTDARDMAVEINQHRNFLSVTRGVSVGTDEAAMDWIARHVGAWRHHRESLGQNGFLSMVMTADGTDESLAPVARGLCGAARQYDADVYLHTSRLPAFHFILQGKPFIHVRTLCSLPDFLVRSGDRLVFIATGQQAPAALDALGRIVSTWFRAA